MNHSAGFFLCGVCFRTAQGESGQLSKEDKMLKKKNLWRGLTMVFALLLAVSMMAGNILELYRTSVDAFHPQHPDCDRAVGR